MCLPISCSPVLSYEGYRGPPEGMGRAIRCDSNRLVSPRDSLKGYDRFLQPIDGARNSNQETRPVKNATERIARFIANTRYENIPRPVLDANRTIILDGIANV